MLWSSEEELREGDQESSDRDSTSSEVTVGIGAIRVRLLESSVEADIAQDDASEFTELQVAARQWLLPFADLREIDGGDAFSTEERARGVRIEESRGM